MSIQYGACAALRWDSNEMASYVQNGDGETEGRKRNETRTLSTYSSARDHRKGLQSQAPRLRSVVACAWTSHRGLSGG